MSRDDSVVFCFSIFVLVVQLLDFGGTASLPTGIQNQENTRCGYTACPVVDPKKLNIHLVAHTHDDVGWLKTVDQYYYGDRNNIQKAGVQYILDSIIEALLNHPDRRFIYVETAYLWKWWLEQDEKTRNNVINLINEGRLEIIGGAWSMNDEAVTHYQSIIDQFTWGFRRLNDTFGSCARPRIGWQIDPFGHSREQASLFAQMGFDGLLFGRLDYQDKSKRLKDKTAEFIWRGSPSLGDRADLFTVAMFNGYSPPPGFCFDVLCADEPIIDNPDSPDYNVEARIGSFLKYVTSQAQDYRTNNIILTMGGDFTYQHAEMWYKNLDKLIRYINQHNGSDYNIFYSTPSCYLKALNDLNLTWTTKSDDFFPYASDPHAYWTGYYTSRPTIKFFERMGNNFLQVAKQLSVICRLQSHEKSLERFREAMGVMQHHDAVTGTEKQQVAEDYARILHQSMRQADEMLSDCYRKLYHINPSDSCLELNISSCAYTESQDQFIVVIYNPLSRHVSTHVRLPVPDAAYIVQSENGSPVAVQIVPIPNSVQTIPGRFSVATNELVFHVPDLPPLQFRIFVVKKTTNNTMNSSESNSTFISNDIYKITVNENNQIVVDWKNQENMNYVQSFHWYQGAEGNNEVFENRSSGAYIFRPKESLVKNFTENGSYKIYKGPLVEEIHQYINDWLSQVVRVYKNDDYVEFDWLVGPIPIQDRIGKEIITRYSSNLNSEKVFYTDSNGREMLERVRDHRSTWDLKLEEPIAGNYYPVTTKISLQDRKRSLRLSVLTDRAQGGTSLQDGEIELMLHRRLLRDDAFGVGEALNETAYGTGLVVRGTHYLFGGSLKNVDKFMLREKELSLKLSLRPWISITPYDHSTFDAQTIQSPNKNLISSELALPPNIHLLTFEPWKDDTILFRLEHLFEIDESPQYSQPVVIDLQEMFVGEKIEWIEEMTLGANQALKDMQRLKWFPETNNVRIYPEFNLENMKAHNGTINVVLKPMEIRTFIIKLKNFYLSQ